MSDDELVARVNMADAKFSFQEKGKMYHPAWIAPEVSFYTFWFDLDLNTDLAAGHVQEPIRYKHQSSRHVELRSATVGAGEHDH